MEGEEKRQTEKEDISLSMTSSLADLISALPEGDGWGPPTTDDTTLNGVPYAPFSKGDKLGRMADWTSDSKDRDGRGGRQQYNRNYRGMLSKNLYMFMMNRCWWR